MGLVETKPSRHFLSRIATSDRPVAENITAIIRLAIEGSAVYSQTVSQIVDFYLDPLRSKELADIVALVQRPDDDAEAEELLQGYVREAQRML